jgi:uncharacterized protein (TIGR03663 family)
MSTSLSTKKERDWALIVILLVGFLFRFLFLAQKPPHFDEGINGWFVDQMISNGYYSYDPTNYHGPFHFYVLWVFKFFMGRNLWALRASASFFGLAGIYLITRLKPYLGKFTAYIGAAFMAVSPGMIFYTRYAIHESELFFFSILALLGFLRFCTQKDKISLWQMGIGITGMIVTKETFVVHMACFSMAYLCLKIYEVFSPSNESMKYVHPKFTAKDVGDVSMACVLIFIVFYSGFFLHFQGVVDFFRSFEAWFGTAQKGNGHQKTFWYWLQLFQHYEIVGLLGVILTLRLLLPSPRWLKLIGIYGVGTLIAYSIVPYKTPWCVLNIVWPFYLIVGGILAELASRSQKFAAAAIGATVALSIPMAAQSVNLNFYKFEDESEPYVYVQTFSDIMKINKKVLDVVKRDPAQYHMTVKLFMDSNWPIPWLLGDFTHAAYYGAPNSIDPNGDLIFADEKYTTLIETRLNKSYFKTNFRLRSAQEPAVAYFDTTIFKDEFPPNSPKFTAKPPEPLLPGQGLLAQFFTNATWTGAPVFKRILPKPSFVWVDAERPLPAPFGILISGEIFIAKAGSHFFYLSSDDGSDLYIDDNKIIDNQGMHPDLMKSGTADLKGGWHKLKIHYNDFGGGMVLRLWWNNENGFQDDIDPKYFRVKDVSGSTPP